jgi:hypothetical protein
MTHWRHLLVVVLVMLAGLAFRSSAQAIAPNPPDSTFRIPPASVCRRQGFPFVEPCQTVHAMLGLTNGTPGARLWKIGTKRILGVWEWIGEGSPCPLPASLNRLLGVEDKVVYADFVVRPVSRSTPGYMQMVCVASASKIVTRPAYFIHGRRQ